MANATAALQAQLSTRTGKARYTVSFGESAWGRTVVLTGNRGARYESIINKHDGLHRFIDAPVSKLVLRVDGDTVALRGE